MKTILTLILCFLFIQKSGAQTESSKSNLYRAVIDLNSSSDEMRGQLYRTCDSSVVLLKRDSRDERLESKGPNLLTLPVNDVDEIRIYRKGRGGRGALNGFLIGALTGGIIGLAGGNDKSGLIRFSAGDKALLAGASLGIVGTLIGAIAGSSAEVWIPIKGNQKDYNEHRTILADYTIVK